MYFFLILRLHQDHPCGFLCKVQRKDNIHIDAKAVNFEGVCQHLLSSDVPENGNSRVLDGTYKTVVVVCCREKERKRRLRRMKLDSQKGGRHSSLEKKI